MIWRPNTKVRIRCGECGRERTGQPFKGWSSRPERDMLRLGPDLLFAVYRGHVAQGNPLQSHLLLPELRGANVLVTVVRRPAECTRTAAACRADDSPGRCRHTPESEFAPEAGRVGQPPRSAGAASEGCAQKSRQNAYGLRSELEISDPELGHTRRLGRITRVALR